MSHKRSLNKYVKYAVIVAITVLFVFLAVLKPGEKTDQLWTVRMKGLEWGMDEAEARKYYAFADDGAEVSPGIFHYALKEPQEIFECPMEVTLVFEADYGLVGILGNTEEVGNLEKNIDKVMEDYRIGSQPGNGISWKSDLVKDAYSKEELTAAYIEKFGDNEVTESVLTGLFASPLVSYELITSGNLRGRFFMDGNTLVKVNGLL